MGNSIMHEKLTINEQSPIIARFYNYDKFTYPWHFHSEYEIIFVKEGEGDRFVADSMEPFVSGDLILLGNNVPHYMRSNEKYYKADASLRVKGVVIQFANNYMAHAISQYGDLAHIKHLLSKSRRGFHFPYPENKELIRHIEQLPHYEGIERIVNLLMLLDKMASFQPKRLLGSPHFDETPAFFSDKRIEIVFSYINYHYTETIRLEHIASIVSMNPAAFCRYFKEKTGKPFMEYIQKLRTGYACKLLASTSYDVSQISLECGFNTICHFNKIFKRYVGRTPSEYREHFINKFI